MEGEQIKIKGLRSWEYLKGQYNKNKLREEWRPLEIETLKKEIN